MTKLVASSPKATRFFKRFLIFWELFIGFGALLGSAMMFYDPSGKALGMDSLLSDIQKLPFSDCLFQDFLVCGIALLLVNGLTNFIAYAILIRKSRYAGIAGLFCGIILMLWITIQFIIFPFNILSTMYFIFGLIQAYSAYRYHKLIFSR